MTESIYSLIAQIYLYFPVKDGLIRYLYNLSIPLLIFSRKEIIDIFCHIPYSFFPQYILFNPLSQSLYLSKSFLGID